MCEIVSSTRVVNVSFVSLNSSFDENSTHFGLILVSNRAFSLFFTSCVGSAFLLLFVPDAVDDAVDEDRLRFVTTAGRRIRELAVVVLINGVFGRLTKFDVVEGADGNELDLVVIFAAADVKDGVEEEDAVDRVIGDLLETEEEEREEGFGIMIFFNPAGINIFLGC